jgi:predicted transposase/invertase (TIGR01784 family)
MKEAIGAYRQVTATNEFRELERQRERARHNEAAALRHARMEGKAVGIMEGILETAKKLKSMGISFEQISQGTGLSFSEIEKL